MVHRPGRSTLAACIAHIAGVSPSEVPLDQEEQRAWLGERGLGLVPVKDAASFSWAGPWIARRPAHDGGGPRAVVMFGVPSGPIWDPADTAGEILDGFVLAPLDVAAWPAGRVTDAGVGVVEVLVIAPAAEAPVTLVDEAPSRDGACKATAPPTETGRSAPAGQAAHSPSSTPPSSTP